MGEEDRIGEPVNAVQEILVRECIDEESLANLLVLPGVLNVDQFNRDFAPEESTRLEDSFDEDLAVRKVLNRALALILLVRVY